MMIYLKRRVSSFADSLKSLHFSIPESNRKEPNTLVLVRRKTKATEVAFNATKDDDVLLEKKSVIFCWLTEVTLSLHPEKQSQITKHIVFGGHKNLANWGRIQRDERWWWFTWKEERHLLLTHWSHFIPPSRKGNATNEPHRFCWAQKHSQLRSYSTRRKMTMIYFKRRVSSFADSLKSLYPSIPVRNRK